jgi:LPS sulfotransferase NodH
MISYLICATHRSGSNLLCEVLSRTEVCGRPEEFFSPTKMEQVASRLGLSARHATDFPAYVRELIDLRSTPNGVFGAKIMRAHLAHFVEQMGFEAKAADDALRSVFPNLHYIWIRRDDKLCQAISMWKAKQTNIYASWQEGKREVAGEPVFDFDEITKQKERFEREDREWEAFFARNRIVPIKVSYEALAQDHQGDAARIIGELGIKRPARLAVQELSCKKQADAVNEQWRLRYQVEAMKKQGTHH